ncbi:hypothetical protein F8S12_31020, partial [Nostoc sp. WHI]|nr:hypothetical protein [Nostoc sp. WHI]
GNDLLFVWYLFGIYIVSSSPYSLLPTPYSLLPTPYSLLPTPHSPFKPLDSVAKNFLMFPTGS